MPPPPPQPDPNQALVQAQLQIEQIKAQSKMSEAQLKVQADERAKERSHELDMAKLALEQQKLNIDREKIASQERQTAAKIQSDEDQAAANLLAQSRKAQADLESKDKDRAVTIAENRANRDQKTQLAQAKKKMRTYRDENGNLVAEEV